MRVVGGSKYIFYFSGKTFITTSQQLVVDRSLLGFKKCPAGCLVEGHRKGLRERE